jgi:SAM-dependent methyltransferase
VFIHTGTLMAVASVASSLLLFWLLTVEKHLEDLLQQASRVCENPQFKQCVLAHCSHLPASAKPEQLNARVHPSDQMLIHSLQHHANADVALSQYFSISLQQYYATMQVYRCFFDLADDSVQVLDFACGYGRLLRLLTLSIPPSRVAASEIQPDAVAYVAEAFTVEGILSHLDPQQFQPGRQFDFIWVASLFSHLPDRLFRGWMSRLTSLLSPRGVLCFSVRGSNLLPAGQILPDSGLLYFPMSEVTDLESDVYGTTYASEAYVSRVAQQALSNAHACKRLPKALAHEQDLYVVCKDPNRSLASLEDFRRGPWGWVDIRSLDSDGNLSLEGWAASLDDGAVKHVEIKLDGNIHVVATQKRRDDVRDAFDDERFANSGWTFTAALGGRTAVHLEVSARSLQDEVSLLFVGTVSS